MVTTLAEINRKAVEAASRIKLLGSVSWPRDPAIEAELLGALERGRKLPPLDYPVRDYSDDIAVLQRLRDSFRADDPLELVTRANIDSYIDAALMVHAVGQPELTEISCRVFGRPGDVLPGTSMTNLSAADRLVALGRNFEHPYIEPLPEDTLAEDVASELGQLVQDHMSRRGAAAGSRDRSRGLPARDGALPLRILVVEGLAAKASATSDTIRLRAGRWFNHYDARQLFAHEVMVHALTARNGLAQPVLSTMGRGAPRTTSTQEGLATFSELVTGAMDLKRLLRLALRTVAIERALAGADFRETYAFFVSHGQGSQESLYSTLRIFRGSQAESPTGVFTKDVVYLAGLLRIHALFRWALAHRRIGLVHLLFCGRIALEDCFLLEGTLEDGTITPPGDLPDWYENIEGLAGQLTFSAITGMLGGEGPVFPPEATSVP